MSNLAINVCHECSTPLKQSTVYSLLKVLLETFKYKVQVYVTTNMILKIKKISDYIILTNYLSMLLQFVFIVIDYRNKIFYIGINYVSKILKFIM